MPKPDLTQEQVKALLLYCPSNGDMYWICPPRNHPELLGTTAGSPDPDGRMVISIERGKFRRSRLAFLFMEGYMPEIVDHINNDPTDDRWSNLRDASATTNNWNRKTGRANRELPMGVRQLKNGKYIARITVNKRQMSLGTASDIETASRLYESARRKYYGEFA